ncbi:MULTISPECIES: DegV family protein [unclassified Meiothermus]|uniref:DegV family protein n=1 Tax=unclassified Meiothermus TaxID=370471 RepID=UPI000D7CE284|nr:MULTISPECIES: DegV family protein [unclassified Meiothermus]PZA07851.1 fatty acid-binding protein DegV [Meiothermus sp. Pnk-1]RYM38845.1 DegV family protein [Meiothermus sp. PNK-Is4]
MSTAFVADSTLGLSPQEALEREIHLLPQQVVIQGKSYRDYFEITPQQVTEAQLAGQTVSTSQVAPADFEAKYEELLHRFERVVSVHVSGKLSGTVATARRVAEKFAGRVQVLDSLSLNAGLGYVLEEARKKLREGVPIEQLEAAIAPLRDRVRGYVLPETLTYLHRSGRVSGLQSLVGKLLKILPVLEVRGGVVHPIDRVRGFHRGLAILAERFHQAFPQGARFTLAHSSNAKGLEDLRRLLCWEGLAYDGERDAGAAVSAHTGPGTVAIFGAPRCGR